MASMWRSCSRVVLLALLRDSEKKDEEKVFDLISYCCYYYALLIEDLVWISLYPLCDRIWYKDFDGHLLGNSEGYITMLLDILERELEVLMLHDMF